MKQLDTKAVWLFFLSSLWAWLFIFAGIFFGLFISSFSLVFNSLNRQDGNGVNVFVPILLFIALWVAASFVWSKLTYHFYRYELREDGFRKEHGIIWKKYVTIPYDRIQNVDIYRGLIARILGLSDLQIQTAGGITAGSYGAYSEGRLPGLSKEVAEQIRDEVIRRSRQARSGINNQGL